MTTPGGSIPQTLPAAGRICEVQYVLDPFNQQLNLSEAYNWQRDEIYEWLKKVVQNVNNVLPLAENTLDDLKKIGDELVNLSLLDGKDYIAPELKPDQHILRQKNSEFPAPPDARWDEACLLKVRGHFHDNSLYSSPYDLLGLFLSSLGPAPVGATKANFYLPLTAVYGWWCTQIAGERNKQQKKGQAKVQTEGTGWFPGMFQCTWRKKEGQPDQFFLGASIAGYPKEKPGQPQMTAVEQQQLAAENGELHKWQLAVKYGRYQLLEGSVVPCGWDFEHSPSIKVNGLAGNKFGNCAETHPFVKLLRNHTDADGDCHGFALKNSYISATATNYSKVMTDTSYKKYLVDPCQNCEALILLFKGEPSNFDGLNEFRGLYQP